MVVQFDDMNVGLFNTTKNLIEEFHNFGTSACSESREEKFTIIVWTYNYD